MPISAEDIEVGRQVWFCLVAAITTIGLWGNS